MIEKLIPGTGTKLSILQIIAENPNINLTELIKKAKSSPNSVLEYVNNLEARGVLNSNKIKGKKIAVRNI